MAISVMPRTGHKTYSAGTDPHPNREQFNERMRLHEALVTLSSHGTPQQRPSAGSGKRFYVSVETNGQRRLYWDDGSSWQEITTNGGGGAGASIAVVAAGSEGTSLRSARADHRHPLPLATPTAPGAMSSQDKLKLNSATSAVQGGTLMERTAQGNTFVASPTASGHAVNRQYVDDVADELNGGGGAGRGMAIEGVATAVEGTSLYNARADHTHPLRLARTTEPGAMSAFDKSRMNDATFERTPNTLALRASNGAIQVNTGGSAYDAANKGYVDGQVSDHTHDLADINPIERTLITPASGWAHFGAADEGYARMKAAVIAPGTVLLTGMIRATGTPSNGMRIATLGAAYRPSGICYFPAIIRNGSSATANLPGMVSVGPDGATLIYGNLSSSTSYVVFSGTYFLYAD